MLYLWLIAWMTSGEVRVPYPVSAAAWSPSSFQTRRGATCYFENGHEDGHDLRKAFRRRRHNTCIVGLQHAPNCPPYTLWRVHIYPHPVLLKVFPEVKQIPYKIWILTDAYQCGMYHSSEEDIQKR